MNKIQMLLLFFATLLLSCERSIDYNISDIPSFEPLKKPEAGKGYQVHVEPFPVPANFEREWYMRLPLGNKEKIYVTSFEAKMRPGTHHLIAYPFKDENAKNNPPIGVMRDQNLVSGNFNLFSNTNTTNFILETTAPEYRIDIPEGYAIPFEAGTTLDFNSHYFNKTTNTLFGEVYLNIYTKSRDEVKYVLDNSIDDNHEKLILPANKVTVIADTIIYDKQTKMVMLTSHCHKHGERFEIYKVGGQDNGKLLYTSTDYVHPPILYYNNPMIFEKGEGMRYVVTYNNKTNREINFGVTSEDEMGILFAYVFNN